MSFIKAPIYNASNESENRSLKTDFGQEITQRFLLAVESVLNNGRITQQNIGKAIGISSRNINRLKKEPERRVTVDACGRLCHHYKVSAFWLLTGKGEMYRDEELTMAQKMINSRVADLEKPVADIQKAIAVIKRSQRKRH